MPLLSALISQSTGILVAYCAAVILASVVGGMVPQWLRLTHTGLQLLISLVGGVMLGIAIFHMIPHASAQLGPEGIDQLAWAVMLGLLSTFFLLRFFHFHQHGPADFGIADTSEETHVCSEHTHATHLGQSASPLAPPEHAGHTGQASQASHSGHAGHSGHAHRHHESPRWLGVLLGLGMHTLLDGMALAASVKAEALHDHGMWLAGFGTFLAVFLHKPLDAVSITSLMVHSNPAHRLLVNIGFALMCPVGAILFWNGAELIGSVGTVAGWALAFSAGVFLCISLSDLLPEMEFHSHNRIRLTVALLVGIGIAWAIGLVEGAGAHSHHGHNHGHDHGHLHDHP